MKPFTTLAVVIFSLVSLGHLSRLILGWEVTVNGIRIPLWISGPGTVLPALIAVMLWRENRRGRNQSNQ